MKRILLRIFFVIVTGLAFCCAWIFGGRQVSLLIDRIATVHVWTSAMTPLAYEGNLEGGSFRIGDAEMGINDAYPKSLPLRVVTDPKNRLTLLVANKTFVLGPVIPTQTEGLVGSAREFTPEPGDQTSFIVESSALSWPTPFDFNFMTGYSPSWKRHRYHRLTWKKPSGEILEMVWRYQQWFYARDGWTNANMTFEGSTGLVLARIRP